MNITLPPSKPATFAGPVVPARTIYRVYIAGPMRGYKYYNFDAFDRMEQQIRCAGHIPISPAQLDRQNDFNPYNLPEDHDWNSLSGLDLKEIIKRDVDAVQSCDAYVMLPGWEKSKGATAEKALLDWQGAVRLDNLTLQRMFPHIEEIPPAFQFVPCESGEKLEPVVKEVTEKLNAQIQETRAVGAKATTPGETIVTDPKTGGQKAQKLARFDLIPSEPLWELAEVYGRGAQKYADDNWRKGYRWRLSIGALQRHLHSWLMGEQRDELGNHHLAQVAWHCFTLMIYEKFGLGTDDRAKKPEFNPIDPSAVAD